MTKKRKIRAGKRNWVVRGSAWVSTGGHEGKRIDFVRLELQNDNATNKATILFMTPEQAHRLADLLLSAAQSVP